MGKASFIVRCCRIGDARDRLHGTREQLLSQVTDETRCGARDGFLRMLFTIARHEGLDTVCVHFQLNPEHGSSETEAEYPMEVEEDAGSCPSGVQSRCRRTRAGTINRETCRTAFVARVDRLPRAQLPTPPQNRSFSSLAPFLGAKHSVPQAQPGSRNPHSHFAFTWSAWRWQSAAL